MLIKQFKAINESNRRNGVHPWNEFVVLEQDNKFGTVSLQRINLPYVDVITVDTERLLEEMIKNHMIHIINPEALKNSAVVKNYVTERTLCIQKIEEVRQFFSEKNCLNSEDISFAYKLAVDCRDHINPKHKYEIELGNFLEIYIENAKNMDMTCDCIMKKIKKEANKIVEIGCFSPNEQNWLKKTVKQELKHIVDEVLE